MDEASSGQLAGEATALDMAADDWDAEAATQPRETAPRGQWLIPTLAVLLVLGWSGAFLGANLSAMRAGASLDQWVGWVEGWSGPAMLIGVGWLLAMRSSKRQSLRFVDAARMLEAESALLETRLATTNRELSLAREFLSSQSRDLESLGRVAVERIGQHASQLQQLIHENSAQLDTIGTVSAAARENMELLRGQLPVIASAAKDVTNNIGNSGRVAHIQLQELVNGLTRLNEFGVACERQVGSVRHRIDEALNLFDHRIDQIDTAAKSRFEALSACSTKLAEELSNNEAAAVDALQARAKNLGAEIDEARGHVDAHEAENLASLRARLSALREEAATMGRSLRETETRALEDWRGQIARLDSDVRATAQNLEAIDQQASLAAHERLEAFAAASSEVERRLANASEHTDAEIGRRHEAQQQRLVELGAASAAAHNQMAAIEARVTGIASEIELAQAMLLERVDRLASTLAESRHGFVESEAAIASLTDGSVRLLELIQASVQHSRDSLPKAIGVSEERLSSLEARAAGLRDTVAAAGTHGDELARQIDTTQATLGNTLNQIGELQGRLDACSRDQSAALEDLRGRLSLVDAETNALATHVREELSGAIAQLSGAAREAVASIESEGVGGIARIAEMLGEESGTAIERAMHSKAAEVAGQLEAAAAHAAGVSREAAVQFRNQLAKVDELVSNLERRVGHAREQAEEQVDNDFARRVAVITESLNSNAIDIAKALDTEVSDTAWAGYLRGDRGIFTRRAVKLLEAPEAKAITQLYEADSGFHNHVSHYIHDFEAMLRQLLSTRDGHSLGVTLLSSDMGKLYVALAQAIDRLRD